MSGGRGHFADKLHGNTTIVIPDDLAVAFHVLLVFTKGAGNHYLLANDEALPGLDVNAAFTDVFDGSLKKFAVGGKMRVLRTGGAGEYTGFLVAHFPKPTFKLFIGARWILCRGGSGSVFFHFVVPETADLGNMRTNTVR